MSAGDLERVFLGWQVPVLEQVVGLLVAGGECGPALDLEDTVVVVPTAEAGRRLRRSLALWAEERGAAVSVPHVWHPQTALLYGVERAEVAGVLDARLAWVAALRAVDLAGLGELLPVLPEDLDWAWYWRFAGVLVELKELLGAGGLTMADVFQWEGEIGERARWRELALLEGRYQAQLGEVGLVDGNEMKARVAAAPQLPDGVRRVVVVAAPDLPPLMEVWLRGCGQQGVAVCVGVQAPADLAGAFDGVGRPLPGFWSAEAGLDVGLREEQVVVCADPVGQVEGLMADLDAVLEEGLKVAVGVADAELLPLLGRRLAGEGIAVYDPGGAGVQSDGLWYVLEQLLVLCEGGSWAAFTRLLRVGEVRCLFAGTGGRELLKQADELSGEALPVTLEMACELLEGGAGEDRGVLMGAVREGLRWRERFLGGDMLEVAREFLIGLYGERAFAAGVPADERKLAVANAWLEEVERVAEGCAVFGLELSARERWGLALEGLGRRGVGEVRGDVDLVLQGWLELLWEDARALVVLGVNEEAVPGVLLSHPFLPDGLRGLLGLPCEATRFARDAYLLRAMVVQREVDGWLRLRCGQWSAGGEVRRPSRLLMLCGAGGLVRRVQALFPREVAVAGELEVVAGSLWPVPVGGGVVVETISVTRLGDYLRCPLDFYLKHVLKMSAVEVGLRELDAMQFGSLIHEVLRRYGEDGEVREWVDEGRLKDWLETCAREVMRERFGRRLPPLVGLQLDAAVERLRYQAEVEVAERLAGWRVLAVELDFGAEDYAWSPLMIEGARLVGKIDRVERHVKTGALRAVDFKTSERATRPDQAHLRSFRVDDEAWSEAPEVGGKVRRWTSLQLPLYAAVLRVSGLGRVEQVGYGCLPKNVTDTRFEWWEDFGDEWVDAALGCAGKIVQRLREGCFEPGGGSAVGAGNFAELLGAHGYVVQAGAARNGG